MACTNVCKLVVLFLFRDTRFDFQHIFITHLESQTWHIAYYRPLRYGFRLEQTNDAIAANIMQPEL